MKRIQMKHYYDYEWRKNPNAVYIGRGRGEYGKWGNPFKESEYGLEECLRLYREWLEMKLQEDPTFLEPLRGKDLVCFCSLNSSCHGDIIIEFLSRDNKRESLISNDAVREDDKNE